jgi:hypothetical protein
MMRLLGPSLHVFVGLDGRKIRPPNMWFQNLNPLAFQRGSFVRLLSETSSLEGAFDGLTKEGHLKLLDANKHTTRVNGR